MSEAFYQDSHVTIFNKDCRNMSELGDNSIHCVVTSPPYWDLRKYEGEQELIWDGDKDCEHQWQMKEGKYLNMVNAGEANRPWQEQASGKLPDSGFCSLCGAWKGAFGLEPTPELYVQHTIEALRVIRRVLRKDGVVFWDIGDSYAAGKGTCFNPGGGKGSFSTHGDRKDAGVYPLDRGNVSMLKAQGLKPKDLCLIPFHVAIAAQRDGWWIRSVIIWSKPNPMPESVTDRPTNSYEFILMLTKAKKYYWDADAVREPLIMPEDDKSSHTFGAPGGKAEAIYGEKHLVSGKLWKPSGGRNLRDVWTFPTEPYPEAHFATFPGKLPELCIKAATSEKGCCPKCGKPWARMRQPTQEYAEALNRLRQVKDRFPRPDGDWHSQHAEDDNQIADYETLGWQPTCSCGLEPVPCIVLDPFMGSGKTLWVAKKLGRRAVGYEISEKYCGLALEMNRQGALAIV